MYKNRVINLFVRNQRRFDFFDYDLVIRFEDAVCTSFDNDRDIIQLCFMSKKHFTAVFFGTLTLQHAMNA